jgi:acyl dehydratase
MSLYFNDFSIGQIFLSSKPRLVTGDMIARFGEVSGDINPLHFDEAFAAKSPFGKRIAHGLLGLSVASGLLHETGIIHETIIAFTGGEWKFKKPIFIGDSVSLKMEVSKIKKIGEAQGFVLLKANLSNQRAEIVQCGIWSLLVRVKIPDSPTAS